MLVKEVMTQSIRRVGVSDPILQAACIMRDLDVGMLPVEDEGETLVGTITDRDIAIRATARGCAPETTPVGEIMSKGVLFCYEDDETVSAVHTMEEEQVRRLLVLDKDDRCVGILSLGDIALRAGEPSLSEELLEEVSRPHHA